MTRRSVILDLTRVIKRPRLAAPTGIDRVEIAYAMGLPARLGDRLRFGLRLGGDFVLLPKDEVDAFFARVLPGWEEAGRLADDRSARARLDPVLGPAATAPLHAAAAKAPRKPLIEPWAERMLWFARRRAVDVVTRARNPEPGSIYLNLSHNGLTEGGRMLAFAERMKLLPAFFLHDLIPITFPEYARAGDDAMHRERLDTMLRRGRLIIVNSDDTRDALLHHARAQGLAAPECLVAHLGISDMWYAPPAAGTAAERPPYFVTVGTIEARKNHLMLLNVWRRLVEIDGAHAPRLVIVGKRGWEIESAVDMLERCATIRDHVIEAGSLSDALTIDLVRGARAMLFPSFVEGYGMPLVEGMACGTPVIAADIPTFREVGGDIPLFVDPLDGPGWVSAVRSFRDADAPARVAQLARLAGYAPPTWDGHLDTVCDALDRM
ncbi:glycosyltransferase family 4 protein [Methylobrevis pamukkalensis]|uniref:D-inositol-3-phosphate glycosyltransferase n=1 Tax=Methylobrevis pamukkalensis TaxID=1439726 RepID=A0A1E3H6K8_9HYPH|nr:glycosyltransferase family 1 protein [Methylobrevis pamukkalensis]ODN71944.1 D-inositol-3-phosphate glycosyltransferase [Methylobrevis pamukkalensis]